jgi:hypothetical protein
LKTITVTKRDLLQQVKTNRTKHTTELSQAMQGWRAQYYEKLTAALELLQKQGNPEAHIFLQPPADHTKDYDRVIGMLELTTQDVVELDQLEFDRYVRDEWEWAGDKLLNATYARSVRH